MCRRKQSGRALARAWAVAALLAALLAGVANAAQQPAVLVVSPQGADGGWVDLGYLADLRTAGFQVDYTASMADFTWNRIRQYNVLVLYTCPPPPGVDAGPFHGAQPIYSADFIALVERFLQQGGGVLLMAAEQQIRITLVRDMITRWGADLPLERIADPDHQGVMSRMPTVPLAYTNAVATSPVSTGVRGIWYPTDAYYNGAKTAPIYVDGNWQIVVQAMPSARTVPVNLAAAANPGPPNPLIRPGGVTAPPLFAIRQYGAGRIALLAQLPVFSIGSGTKWLYNREILSAGEGGTPSDFGVLLANSFSWLGAPSLASRAVGGYVTPANRLVAPNRMPGAANAYAELPYHQDDPRLLQPPTNSVMFTGLIGAQTSLTGGTGTVADWANAARAAGLDFLVFLEDFTQLDATKLAQLNAACQQNSDGQLTLYPGYRLDNNIGNHMFLFGNNLALPPAQVLTKPDQQRFMLQGETAPGVFGVTPTYPIDYILSLTATAEVGYYDFSHSGMGMRVPDARLYGMAAVRTYRDGALVDDATADYLTTAQATSVPAPIAVHLMSDPAGLDAAVRGNQGVTYAQARARASLWNDALRYSSQYDCLNVFPSTGPQIVRWPGCTRVSTFGAEPFVTGRSRMDAPLYVTADKGLREIRLYDGTRLFRRFVLNGQTVFSTMLHLEGSVQRNLVMVVEDVAGGQAVSGARRAWKDGSLAPVFCSDRINDCGNMFLARGPYPMTVLRTPELPDAGVTWDGGPKGVLTPIVFEGSNPMLASDQGAASGDQYDQTPLLEFADEGAVGVRSEREELFDQRVRAVNPWQTYGPRAPAQLMDFSLGYVEWDRASVAAPPTGWAAPPQQTGCNAAVFRGTVTFSSPLNLSSLQVLRNWHWLASVPMHLVVGRGTTVRTDVNLGTVGKGTQSFQIAVGDWFGFYSPQAANSQFFVNRGGPLELRLTQPPNSYWLTLWAVIGQPAQQNGQTYTYELSSVGCPLDAAAHDAETLRQQVAYLASPDGLQISRGQRANTPGLLEVVPDGYVAHVAVPTPKVKRQLTLPVMVSGLNPRWSAGLWQHHGFVKGDYGTGDNRYRSIGMDLAGRAYVPVYPDLAAQSDVEIGHPVSADASGAELFIQVTALSGGSAAAPEYSWIVEVNNPTDHPITSTVTQNMSLPNLNIGPQTLTLAAGEQRVLFQWAYSGDPPAPTATATIGRAPTRTPTGTRTPTPTRTVRSRRPPSATPTPLAPSGGHRPGLFPRFFVFAAPAATPYSSCPSSVCSATPTATPTPTQIRD